MAGHSPAYYALKKKYLKLEKKKESVVGYPTEDSLAIRNSVGNDPDLIEQLLQSANKPREANLYDMTIGSVQRGYLNSVYGQESFNAMRGKENEAKKYANLLAGDKYNFQADGLIGKGVSGAAEQLGQQLRQWTDPETLTLAGGMAGAASLAGKAGPQLALPEEVITVPGAFLGGMKLGSAKSNLEIEAGHSYNELLENGVSEDTARKIAMGVGVGNAALDLAQLDELVKSFKVLQRSGADDTVLDIIGQELKRRGLDVAKETVQEVAQEGVTIGGTQLGSYLDKGEFAYDTEEVLARLGDTAAASALTFGMMNVPGGVHNVYQSHRQKFANPVENNVGKGENPVTTESAKQPESDWMQEDAETAAILRQVAEEMQREAQGETMSARMRDNIQEPTLIEEEMQRGRRETIAEAPRMAQERPFEPVGVDTTQVQGTAEAVRHVPLSDLLAGGNRVDMERLTEHHLAEWGSQGGVWIDANNRAYQMQPEQHISQRTAEGVGNRKVNAFQFDHPELRQYVTRAAEDLVKDASLSLNTPADMRQVRDTQGKKYITEILESRPLRQAMDMGLSRNEIIKAAEDLIADHGQENYAAAKRLELILDEMLTEGYTTVEGEVRDPDTAYIQAKAEIPGYQERQREALPIWDMEEGVIRAAQAAYDAGRANVPREKAVLIDPVQEEAYQAGRLEHIRNMKPAETVEKQETGGYTEGNRAENRGGFNNGREKVHSSDSGQRAGSENPAGAVPGVESRAGTDQGRKDAGRARGAADPEAASLTYHGQAVSTASLGIARGSRAANIHLVKSGETAVTRKAKQIARERGLRLILFSGNNLEIRTGNTTVSTRAYITGDRVFVRADHPDFTAEQLMRHEAGHDMIAKGEVDPDTVRERILEDFGAEKVDDLSRMYAEAYEGSNLTAEEIWEEIICDSLADMNIFAKGEKAAAAAAALADTKKAVAEAEREQNRGPPEGKMSREPTATASSTVDPKMVAQIQKGVRSAVREELDRMGKEYGWIEPGEHPARTIQMPRRTSDDKKLSRTVRTVMEAQATPEELLPDIEQLAAEGAFSFESYTDKQAIRDATEKIGGTNGVGWEQAYSDWSAAMKKGEVSKEQTAMGWVLYNNAANEGNTKLALDILDQMVRHQRSAAQALQATRILKKLSPETQLYHIQQTVNGINEDLRQRHEKKRRAPKYGNVPVELWMQRTGELLAEQLGKAVSQKPTRKEMTVSQRVLADLRKLANETIVPTAKTLNTRTEMDFIYDMFNNQEHYEKALAAAKETVVKEYGNNPEIMGALDQWMQTAFDYTAKFTKEFTGQTEIQIPKELVDKFLSQTDQEGRDEVTREIYRYIGSQMPSSFVDKWNAWRYLAMLGNPRTHVRNVLGNAGFVPVVAVKNLAATWIEAVVYRVSGGKLERSKKLVGLSKSDRALLAETWGDYAKVAETAMDGGKYDDFANANKYIEQGRVIFKNPVLEKARKGNTRAMEQEDVWFSRPHYAYALAQYCKAHGITADQLKRGKALGMAREYAVKEAQKATYRDTNALSQAISGLGRYHGSNPVNKGISVLAEGLLPFRKTPANILARGLEYSPLGLMNGVKQALWDVRKGKKTGAEAIDSISAGLTGTCLLILGGWMAAQGLIRGGGSGDEEEKEFAELMGHQTYALELPDGTSVTLDWLAPECLPFFVGVNLWEQTGSEKATLSDWLEAVSGITEPLLEMSCLQSLNDAFDAVGYVSDSGVEGLPAFLADMAASYMTQGIPTLLGQIERTSQAERMTTYTSKSKWTTSDIQRALGTASGKIPGWDYRQIPYIDAWGRTERTGAMGERAFNNFLNPAYMSKIEESPMERELLRLYEVTGKDGVFPTRAERKFTVDQKEKELTAEEYVKYATTKGQTAYKLIGELTTCAGYQKLSDREKAEAVKKAYEYASQTAKAAVSDYEVDPWVKNTKYIKTTCGISQGTFLSMRAMTREVESLKEKGKDGELISIDNSKGLQIMEKIYDKKLVTSLTQEQREALFAYLGVGKSVRHYNQARVREKLGEMRKRAV